MVQTRRTRPNSDADAGQPTISNQQKSKNHEISLPTKLCVIAPRSGLGRRLHSWQTSILCVVVSEQEKS